MESIGGGLLCDNDTPTQALTKDDIAALLKVIPDALAAFEKAYHTYTINEEPDNFFQQNSRQAVEQNRLLNQPAMQKTPDTSDLQRRIVDELLAQTQVYFFDGNLSKVQNYKALPENVQPVSLAEISSLPASVQPQLTGNLMKRDIGEDSASILLWQYREYLTNPDPQIKRTMYQMFQQGLDILDLDGLTYEIIGTNPNSMGHWLHQLAEACRGKDFFKIPRTAIAKVPLTLLQLTRQDYHALTPTTVAIIDAWSHEAFQLDDSKEYFIKTGTYSSKFDFRNAHVMGAKEVRELGEYLLFIHSQVLQMAGPLCTPSVYGVSTINEWVVREWIADTENNPCIYKELSLHTEYRFFIDCDPKQILGGRHTGNLRQCSNALEAAMMPIHHTNAMIMRFTKLMNIRSCADTTRILHP